MQTTLNSYEISVSKAVCHGRSASRSQRLFIDYSAIMIPWLFFFHLAALSYSRSCNPTIIPSLKPLRLFLFESSVSINIHPCLSVFSLIFFVTHVVPAYPSLSFPVTHLLLFISSVTLYLCVSLFVFISISLLYFPLTLSHHLPLPLLLLCLTNLHLTLSTFLSNSP